MVLDQGTETYRVLTAPTTALVKGEDAVVEDAIAEMFEIDLRYIFCAIITFPN